MKVIHVGFSYYHEVHASPNAKDEEDLDSMFEKNHFGSWATPLVRKISEHTKNYEIEVWRPYDSDFFGNRGISVLNKEGMTFRTFPTKFFFKPENGRPKQHYANTVLSISTTKSVLSKSANCIRLLA